MTNSFRKLMRRQVQELISPFSDFSNKAFPKRGWIRVMRESLGMSSLDLAKRVGCSRANIVALESREKKQAITLESLDQVAKAMNCTLVYCFVPQKPLEQMVEEQARLIAKKQIEFINHSMELEQQGLTPKQLEQQEYDLVNELLRGNAKNLWRDDAI